MLSVRNGTPFIRLPERSHVENRIQELAVVSGINSVSAIMAFRKSATSDMLKSFMQIYHVRNMDGTDAQILAKAWVDNPTLIDSISKQTDVEFGTFTFFDSRFDTSGIDQFADSVASNNELEIYNTEKMMTVSLITGFGFSFAQAIEMTVLNPSLTGREIMVAVFLNMTGSEINASRRYGGITQDINVLKRRYDAIKRVRGISSPALWAMDTTFDIGLCESMVRADIDYHEYKRLVTAGAQAAEVPAIVINDIDDEIVAAAARARKESFEEYVKGLSMSSVSPRFSMLVAA